MRTVGRRAPLAVVAAMIVAVPVASADPGRHLPAAEQALAAPDPIRHFPEADVGALSAPGSEPVAHRAAESPRGYIGGFKASLLAATSPRPVATRALQRAQRMVSLVGFKSERLARRPPPPPPPRPRVTSAAGDVWDRLARCESGGNWQANTGNGYYGGLQFHPDTWRSVGGTGLPHEHTREEQIHRAKILQARAGWGQWPHCSRALGLRP